MGIRIVFPNETSAVKRALHKGPVFLTSEDIRGTIVLDDDSDISGDHLAVVTLRGCLQLSHPVVEAARTMNACGPTGTSMFRYNPIFKKDVFKFQQNFKFGGLVCEFVVPLRALQDQGQDFPNSLSLIAASQEIASARGSANTRLLTLHVDYDLSVEVMCGETVVGSCNENVQIFSAQAWPDSLKIDSPLESGPTFMPHKTDGNQRTASRVQELEITARCDDELIFHPNDDAAAFRILVKLVAHTPIQDMVKGRLEFQVKSSSTLEVQAGESSMAYTLHPLPVRTESRQISWDRWTLDDDDTWSSQTVVWFTVPRDLELPSTFSLPYLYHAYEACFSVSTEVGKRRRLPAFIKPGAATATFSFPLSVSYEAQTTPRYSAGTLPEYNAAYR
jgi:hypothetical protein